MREHGEHLEVMRFQRLASWPLYTSLNPKKTSYRLPKASEVVGSAVSTVAPRPIH